MSNVLKSYKVNLSNEKIENLVETLEYYDGGIIPIEVVKRELDLTYDETHDLLIYLARHGILKINYKVWCDNEDTTTEGKIYEHITDVPFGTCSRCEKECRTVNNVIVVFRVVL